MDLSSLEGYVKKSEEGVAVDVLHPVTGERLCSVTVASYSSQRARLANRACLVALIGKRDINTSPITDSDDDLFRAMMMARLIMSWDDLQWRGEDLPCTYESALMVMKNFPFFLAQLEAASRDSSLFLAD